MVIFVNVSFTACLFGHLSIFHRSTAIAFTFLKQCCCPALNIILPQIHTDAQISLHTLLVKYNNDLLGRQNSERGIGEVTFFYVGDLFCIHLGTKYANFQEKKSVRRFLEKMPKLFIVVTLLQWQMLKHSFQKSPLRFLFLENWNN